MVRSSLVAGSLFLGGILLLGCSQTVDGQGPITTKSATLPQAAAGEPCDCASSTEDPNGDEACCEAGLVCRSQTAVTCSAAGCSRDGVCVAPE